MTPEEKDRETAEKIVKAIMFAYPDLPYSANFFIQDNIFQALHSTRISALKEAAEVLRPFAGIAELEEEGDETHDLYDFEGIAEACRRAKTLHDEITNTLKELEGK